MFGMMIVGREFPLPFRSEQTSDSSPAYQIPKRWEWGYVETPMS